MCYLKIVYNICSTHYYHRIMGIKYKVNEKFFDKWSRQMAYVLGFFCADGNLEDAMYLRGKYVRFVSTDESVIADIRKALGSGHKIYKVKKGVGNRKIQHLLRIGSHTLFDVLFRLGLRPNKSLTMRLPKIPEKYFGDFVRGYFDGDGCVYIGFEKQKLPKNLLIAFTSGSLDFLEDLRKRINLTCNFCKNNVYISHRSFQIRYNTRQSIKLFCLMYKDTGGQQYLKRKKEIFKKYFKLRPNKINSVIKHILVW